MCFQVLLHAIVCCSDPNTRAREAVFPTMMPRTTTYGSLLGTYVRPYWRRTLVLLVLLLAGAGLTLLSPRIMGAFIDAVFGGAGRNTVVPGALFLALALVNQGVTV